MLTFGKVFTNHNPLLSHLPEKIMDLATVEEIAGIVESLSLCQGNSTVALIDIAEKR